MTIFEIVLALVYGLWLQYSIAMEWMILIAFGVPLILLGMLSRKNSCRWDALLTSILLTAVFIGAFFGGDRLSLRYVDEYDVKVHYVSYRGGGFVCFTTPEGEEGTADLHDYRIVADDDDCVQIGDTIHVQEYNGWFARPHYIIEREKTNNYILRAVVHFTLARLPHL